MKYLLDGEESERIHFRKIHLDDFDEWLEFHKDPAARQYWIADFQEPHIECENWYKYQFYRYDNDLGGMNALVEKESGRLVGHCGLLVQTVDDVTELEIGYSLIPQFWNRGYATETARKCMDYAFHHELSDSLISIISLTNKPSERVARKNGMEISKTTVYKSNSVNIFRTDKATYSKIQR